MPSPRARFDTALPPAPAVCANAEAITATASKDPSLEYQALTLHTEGQQPRHPAHPTSPSAWTRTGTYLRPHCPGSSWPPSGNLQSSIVLISDFGTLPACFWTVINAIRCVVFVSFHRRYGTYTKRFQDPLCGEGWWCRTSQNLAFQLRNQASHRFVLTESEH